MVSCLLVFCHLPPLSLGLCLAWNLMEAEFCVSLKYTDQIPAVGSKGFCNTTLESTYNYKDIN